MSQSNVPRAVEIRIFWGDSLLDVVELSPPRAFFVGDATAATLPVDFTVPESTEGPRERTPLVRVDGDQVRLSVPFGAQASWRGKEDPVPSDVVLTPGATLDVRLDDLRFSVRLADREARCPRTLVADRDARPYLFFGASLLAHGSLAAMLALFAPPLGLTDDEALDRERLYLMQVYLDASAEREEKLELQTGESPSGAAHAPADPAAGEAGKMGRPDLAVQHKRASGSEAGAEIRPATRAEAMAEAENFGIIGMLSSGAMKATSAPWDDLGVGPVAAMGELFGTEIGDSGGLGGLSLHGIGEGGGFRGNQIGLRAIGTCTGSNCDGIGIGPGGRRRGRDHVAKTPSIRTADTTVHGGSLPPEVIQRVVRQSFGRFRGCYEDGLRGNPSLEGRVTARFVIGRDGSVGAVQSGGTDLPDAKVVACVLRTYTSLSFPAPKDGIVTVSYPLMFSPSA